MYRIQCCTGQGRVSLLGLKLYISNPACFGCAWDCKGWDWLLRWLHSDHLSLVFLFLRLSGTACQDMLLPGKPLSLWFTCHCLWSLAPPHFRHTIKIPFPCLISAPSTLLSLWSPGRNATFLFLCQLPVLGTRGMMAWIKGWHSLSSFYFSSLVLEKWHKTCRKCLQRQGHRYINPGATCPVFWALPTVTVAPAWEQHWQTVFSIHCGPVEWAWARWGAWGWKEASVGKWWNQPFWGGALVLGLHRKLIFHHRILWHGRKSCHLNTLGAVSKPWARKPVLALHWPHSANESCGYFRVSRGDAVLEDSQRREEGCDTRSLFLTTQCCRGPWVKQGLEDCTRCQTGMEKWESRIRSLVLRANV